MSAGQGRSSMAATRTVASERTASMSYVLATARCHLRRLMPHPTALQSPGSNFGGLRPSSRASCGCGLGRPRTGWCSGSQSPPAGEEQDPRSTDVGESGSGVPRGLLAAVRWPRRRSGWRGLPTGGCTRHALATGARAGRSPPFPCAFCSWLSPAASADVYARQAVAGGRRPVRAHGPVLVVLVRFGLIGDRAASGPVPVPERGGADRRRSVAPVRSFVGPADSSRTA